MSFLPTRDGDEVGKAQEFAMGELAGDCDEIRTVEWQNGDGSVTSLRTRGGMPIFETEKVYGTGASEQSARGFVAMVPGGRAVLFDPYTLAILDSDYSPAGKLYTVEEFATTWNVPASDTTHWYDVVLFDGTVIKINAKAMPDLQIVADQPYPAIPYVISRHDASDQYGNAERNATEKRVFAVGRYAVTSWGGGGVTETLSPVTPRTDNKALTLGQAVDTSSNTATLGQFYFTGASWDSISGGWVVSSRQVSMLLTATYLVGVHSTAVVDMPLAGLSGPVATSGSSDVTRTIPDAVMELVGTSEVNININPADGIPLGTWRVRFPWTGYTTDHVDAKEYNSFSLDTYTGAASATSTQAGTTLTYACSNVFTHSVSTGHVHFDSTLHFKTYHLNPSPIYLAADGSLPDSIYYGPFSTNYIGVPATTFPNFSWTADTTNITFSVDTPVARLVDCAIVYETFTGKDSQLTMHNWAQYFLDNPRSGWGSGSGYNISGAGFQLAGEWLPPGHGSDYYAQIAVYQAVADTFNGLTLHSYGDDTFNYNGFTRYDHVLVDRPAVGRKTLTWSTKDFILCDDVNGVFVTVEGNFTGSGSSAALSMILRVKTRHDETVQTIGTWGFTYSDMLPTREIGSTGRFTVPAPQVRAIFTPLYREQGSFKGAQYVTAAEEITGSTVFHGFNFLLYLRMYDALGSCNNENETAPNVYYIPCNLLEMLYCFVFSSEYGVADSGERYPVTHSANYDMLANSLFTNPVRVTIRNGIVVNWTDGFGGDFSAVPNVSLYRT